MLVFRPLVVGIVAVFWLQSFFLPAGVGNHGSPLARDRTRLVSSGEPCSSPDTPRPGGYR